MANFVALPRTLQEAIQYFSDPAACLDFAVKMRWPDGIKCPHCKCPKVGVIASRQKFKCKNPECRKQFSVKAGTIMEDSPLGLDKWLIAMWMIANCKNGISSYEIHRAISITQKSAWFLVHRIRLAMQAENLDKIDGAVEVDETFIGGKARNMHKVRRAKKIKGRGASGKAIVVGILDRKSRKVRAKVVKDNSQATLTQMIKDYVELGSTVYTDEHDGYNKLTTEEFKHLVIKHAETYVNASIHTNGIENFWSLLKRSIKGTYVSVEPFHLFRYLDEQTYRYDFRKDNDFGRFERVSGRIEGRRVTYKKLTGKLRGKGHLKEDL
jgi:transposase-like protein